MSLEGLRNKYPFVPGLNPYYTGSTLWGIFPTLINSKFKVLILIILEVLYEAHIDYLTEQHNKS